MTFLQYVTWISLPVKLTESSNTQERADGINGNQREGKNFQIYFL